MQTRIAVALLKNRQAQTVILLAVLAIVMLPVIVAAGIVGLVAGTAQSTCGTAGAAGGALVSVPAGGGPLAAGQYAAPLELISGHWYEVGATMYGGPGDPTSGDYGSIPTPGESYLPDHPDSFAELSVLDTNPANSGTFTFDDANALDHLPYLATLRVQHAGRETLLRKRDVGYGQGPGQFIANGQPYRLDVWWQAAQRLAVTKSPVKIELAPATGAAGTLAALPEAHEAVTRDGRGESCSTVEGSGSVPLPLTPGTQTKILPSGLAAAGAQAPIAVKRMVAAGNRLFSASYIYGGGHGPSLDTLQPGYDCSSAVSYVLHAGGVLGPNALDSTGLASYGEPGPGQYVTIYANAAHAFMYVAGLRFDTLEAPTYDTGPNSDKPGPKWRVYPSVPSWSNWTIRHPPGL